MLRSERIYAILSDYRAFCNFETKNVIESQKCRCIFLLPVRRGRPALRFPGEHAKQRQAGGEKRFVRLAVIGALSGALAAAGAAQREEFAAAAAFGHGQALFDKAHGGLALRHGGKIRIGNVAEQIFVRAVKITGVDVAVAFRNKLVRAMPCHAALLWLLPEVHTHEVVKFPHTDILSAHIVLDVEVKYANQKISVLGIRHVKLAVFRRTERPQAGDKLQIPKALFAEKTVDTLAVFGTIAGEHRKDVEFRTVLLENGGGVLNLMKCVLPRGRFTEFVAVEIAV